MVCGKVIGCGTYIIKLIHHYLAQRTFLYAKKLGITIFSTPFDETAVTFLEKLNCPIYKISSFEMTDLPLIKRVALTKKPLIISTGLSSLKEIEETFKVAKRYGAKRYNFIILC